MRIQPSPLENTFGVDFQFGRPPTKQQYPRSQNSPDPHWPYVEHRATGEIGQRGFPEETYLRAEVCAPNTVSLCSMQLLEARFQPFRR